MVLQLILAVEGLPAAVSAIKKSAARGGAGGKDYDDAVDTLRRAAAALMAVIAHAGTGA
jgi:hypothetical protein